MKKVCEWCGEEFEATGKNSTRRRFCNATHYQTCAVCGKVFEIKSMYDIPKCCSIKCTNILRKQSIDKTLLERYGAAHYTQVPSLLEKARASRAAHQAETAAKRAATMVERYGVSYAMQSEELRQKAATTNTARYGAANPAQNAEIRKKISDAVLSPEHQEKYRQTSLKHYGVEHPAQAADVRDKTKATCLDRYGVEYASQNAEVKQRIIQGALKTRILHPEIADVSKQHLRESCLARYGVEWPCQLKQCRDAAHRTISQMNRSVGESLQKLGCSVAYELSLGPYSYDIALPLQHIVLEINPTYTHNAHMNHYGVVRSKDYHRNKTQVAAEHGYRCIHLFDWDNVDSVLQLVAPKTNIYGRTCKLQEIDATTAGQFESQHHIQGSVKGQIVCLGLFYQDQLIQVMTFGKPRYNNNYTWELLRLCTNAQYQVVGGASRLWSHFMKQHSKDSVISYCDVAKFSGKVYAQLGMQLLSITPPAKVWSKGCQKITDNLLRQRGFDQLFGTNFGKGASNEELMLQHGWLPVYDCGQQVWAYPSST